MKILIVSFVALLVLLLLFVGGWWFLSKDSVELPPSKTDIVFPGTTGQSVSLSKPTQEDTAKLENEFYAEVQDATNLTLSDIAISDGYAMAVYSDENVGGMAVFKKDTSGAWILLETDGGVFNLDFLVSLGIPEKTARALLDSII